MLAPSYVCESICPTTGSTLSYRWLDAAQVVLLSGTVVRPIAVGRSAASDDQVQSILNHLGQNSANPLIQWRYES